MSKFMVAAGADQPGHLPAPQEAAEQEPGHRQARAPVSAKLSGASGKLASRKYTNTQA